MSVFERARAAHRKRAVVALTLMVGAALSIPAADAGATKPKMSTPTLAVAGVDQTFVDITVTAGATGAPAGFSLQWETLAVWNQVGWLLSDDPNLCKASFSGSPNASNYNLAPNQSVTVRIGDITLDIGASTNCSNPLVCNTTYVFHAFAHANNTRQRSDFTPDLVVTTAPCPDEGVCSLSQGYWKTHYVNDNKTPDDPSDDVFLWPASGLTLGTVSYTASQLESILLQSVGGNGLVALAHQLITAKLNVANGSDPAWYGTQISDADALIGGLVVPPVGSGFLKPSVTSSLTLALDTVSTGQHHCGGPED
jgi:hypothetical protein